MMVVEAPDQPVDVHNQQAATPAPEKDRLQDTGLRLVASWLGAGGGLAAVPFLPVAVAGWLLMAPVTLRALRGRASQVLALACTAGLVATLVTDTSRGIASGVTVRLLVPLVTFLVFLVSYVWVFQGRLRFHVQVLLIFAMSWLVGTLAFFPLDGVHTLWKYAAASPVGLLAIAVATHLWQQQRLIASTAVGLAAAGLMAVTDFRSYSMIIAVATVAPWLLRLRNDGGGRRGRQMVRLLLGGGVLVVAFGVGASHGAFGSSVQQKWESQGASPLQVLSVGRPEAAFSLSVLPHHLFSGVGTKGQLSETEESVAADAMPLPGPQRIATLHRMLDTGLDVHSVLFQRWLEAGIFGALPILLILGLAARALVSYRADQIATWGPLVPFSAVMLIWDLLFSPWTWFSGPPWAVYAALLLVVTQGRSLKNEQE